ncbi:MAG TPA: TonB-dependent receptor plug domain-containing protein [Ferruginibacter sp.]|nr:TonB-dependent receptor plug domain-containing protein [Ferruginibacter sp.]
MKRIILFAIPLFFLTITAFAQKNLRGKVFDASNNKPLAGATISFGNSGTTTDKDGLFAIDCNKVAVITVSYVGYAAYSRTIRNCIDEMTISLAPVGQNLNEVEITATSSQNKSILYQPSSITKLSTTELKRGNGLFLDDAINGNVPGVTMNRRAVSSGQQFNIRGYGNGSRGPRGVSSNFDGQGYKVYLNGIPVTDAEGITTLDDIDYGSVGNVEVTKGPAGTLYGLAIAGVVNLSTIKPEKGRTSIGQDILIGNYGLQRFTTNFQMGQERSSLLVNYGHQKSDGFTVHNNSHKDFVNVFGDFQPNAKQNITVYGGYSKSYDERSGELTIAQYDRNDFSGNMEYIKRNAHSEVFTVRAGVGHIYNFNNAISNTTTVFGTAFNSNASSAGGWTDKHTTNFGVRSTFNTRFSFNNISLSGITGVEAQRQNGTTLSYNMIDPQGSAHAPNWKIGDPYFVIGTYPTTPPATPPANISGITADAYTTTATTSLFTEWTLALPMDISVTAGIGVSNMKIKLDDRFYVLNKPMHFDTIYKGMISPHFAVNKVFGKQFSAYFSYSKAYKAPVSSYFYIPYVATTPVNNVTGVVNNYLKPEMGNQFELGTKGTLLRNRLTYQFAFFNAVFSNKMTNIAVPNPSNTATLYSYVVNGGKQDDKGFEALVKYTGYQSSTGFFTSITPFINFTYSDFKYKNFVFESGTTPANKVVVDYSGHTVPGVAKVLTNVGFDLNTKPGLYANLTWFYKDDVTVTSNGTATGGVPSASNPDYHAGSYSLLNTKLGFRHSFAGHFDIDAYLGVNNITNTKYPIMIFVNQIPDAFIAGPKNANVFGGLNLKYIF